MPTEQLALSEKPSQDERNRMISHLSECFSRGELSVEEFEDRVTLAHRASTRDELMDVGKGLSAPDVHSMVEAPTTALTAPAEGSAIAIFGGTERSGGWVVPRRTRSLAVFGGVVLDFREAVLPAGEIEVHVTAVMGGVEIIVPPTLQVQMGGAAILGGFEEMHRRSDTSSMATTRLHIRGLAILGGVTVETRLPGESAGDARRRRRGEQRTRRRGEKGYEE